MRYLGAVRQYPIPIRGTGRARPHARDQDDLAEDGSGLGEGQCAGGIGERDPRCAKDIAERVIGALAHLKDA
ncbi:hypothetical protein ACQEV4_22230 [Streptomyces shenzhenensis]|uniref:hypothetical protein n=1 Tax=Streptomyces shenzhenensis TaxID=943815 RepID=UPI003D8F9349